VTEHGFAAMTRSVRRACDALGVPLGLVLEGGYALGPLARSVAATMQQLTPVVPAAPEDAIELHPAALAVRDRLAGSWPALAG
jgi:acetoin utilization deacetylase AcuC-like enzyme